ncbi:MAG: DUF3341 domain-containing protein [Phycisphaerae bacterium]|nr:DUF3341 domain-containing protein [Phycisphaerae bacterium]
MSTDREYHSGHERAYHSQGIYGLLAQFDTPEQLVAAANRVTADGYTRTDAFSPFPVHGLSEALAFRKTWIPELVFIAAVCGAFGGFCMQYLASKFFYPINIGGRPLNSWPAFIPITFEVTVLCAGFTAAISMIALNGLPTPYHPLFNNPVFERASRDSFFLCIESADTKFDLQTTSDYLRSLGAILVEPVPA